MLRIGIVDDHSIIRAGFREMLQSDGGGSLQVAFEAASGEAALEALGRVRCDVLLLDISLPGRSGIEILQDVRRRFPDMRVLIVSGHSEDRYASALIRHGAHGYLCKDCDGRQLVTAIRTVASGRHYLSKTAVNRLAGTVVSGRVDGQLAHHLLSERELQVFLRLASGETVTQIARSLDLSVKTISTYRTRLLDKIGVSSNAELATYAVRNHLIGV